MQTPRPSVLPVASRPVTPARRILVLALLLLLAMALLAPPAQASRVPADLASSVGVDQATPPLAMQAGWSVRDYKLGNKARTNQVRRNRGLHELQWRHCLHVAAQRWADHLARTNGFKHQDLRPILSDCKLRGVSENLALGYTTSRSTINAWMGSSGHRANMVNNSNRRMGVGMAKGPRGWISVQIMGY